jgi:hypothetical protein
MGVLEYALSLARDLAYNWPRGPYQYYLCAIPLSIITVNYHAQFNRSICYILVYIFICAFPILLGYSLWLYYLALHYLFTRDYDYLIDKYRNKTVHLFLLYY